MRKLAFIFTLSLILLGCSQSLDIAAISDDWVTPSATPVARPETQTFATSFPLHSVIRQAECNLDVSGHILFITSRKELYVMDGDACNRHLVMRDVSGSPDWSVDGKYISIGCENNQYICILDASKTLKKCLTELSQTECEATIFKKYKLPEDAEQPVILNTSWSFNSERLMIDIGVQFGFNIYLLNLQNEGVWKLIMKHAKRRGDLSPVADEIIFDGIEKMSLNDGYTEGYHEGKSPEWAPDGEKAAFIYETDQNQNYPLEPFGIMEWTFDAEAHWRILYEPVPINWESWSTRNVLFNNNPYRLLSWSPDSRYIAFVGDYRYVDDAQIFRLDTQTGEVVVLTPKINQEPNSVRYFAPAWGP